MSTLSSEAILITIIVTTFLILLFAVIIVRFIFLYQSKRYRHEKEVVQLRESFSQTLLQSKLEIQEQTLDHISKELHANFSHLVSLININLSEILPYGSGEMKDSIVETKSLAKHLLSELKALSASLNTDHIMHIGFANAFGNELDRLKKIKKYQINISMSGKPYRFSPEHEIILFRLCQEVLNNIVKYAKATIVSITMDYQSDLFQLKISDNGIGFDIDKALSQNAQKESTGIINIRKRARLINATVLINSKENEGTSVEITIPKPNQTQ